MKKNDNITIEHGIEIPKQTRKGKWIRLIEKMKEGDSIGGLTEMQSFSLYVAIRKKGIRSCRRSENGVYRVWRLGERVK